jgi:hypothetical protein
MRMPNCRGAILELSGPMVRILAGVLTMGFSCLTIRWTEPIYVE